MIEFESIQEFPSVLDELPILPPKITWAYCNPFGRLSIYNWRPTPHDRLMPDDRLEADLGEEDDDEEEEDWEDEDEEDEDSEDDDEEEW
jgi:hypothetical protein